MITHLAFTHEGNWKAVRKTGLEWAARRGGKQSRNLQSLRSDEDFQKLLAELKGRWSKAQRQNVYTSRCWLTTSRSVRDTDGARNPGKYHA